MSPVTRAAPSRPRRARAPGAIASSAAAETANDAASSAKAVPDAEHLDEHAAQRRPRQAQRDRPHELVQRVGLGEVAGGQHLGHERVEGRG